MHAEHVLLLLTLTGCVNVETQPDRIAYLEDKTSENIRKLTQCEETTLTFRDTKLVATTWYDIYTLEGCGQKTDYITGLKRTGDWITWSYGAAPTEEELREAAKRQLATTAEFDLECKEELDFSILNETIDPAHTSIVASVGVRGCEKKSTYRTTCAHANYKQGAHEISCTSVITSATSN